MKTIVRVIDVNNINKYDFAEASRILQNGGLVAFPTETVYGLGGDGLNASAAQKIYAAKGRPSDNPLIIHIADWKSLEELAVEIPDKAAALAERFWPGPLTMIFKKSAKVPYSTTGGLETVAVRMPSHPAALALIRESGIYIAAPSANTSGRPSPTLASHVIEDLDGKIDMIIDGGPVGIGLESTIVDMTEESPVILRPGYITRAMLTEVIGMVHTDQAVLTEHMDRNIIPKAPGMKYKHYAPKASLTIYEGDPVLVVETINRLAAEQERLGRRTGIIATEETKERYRGGVVKSIGSRAEEASIARGLYAVLREFDEENVDIILTESFRSDKLGQAIMNRLLKAAGYQVVRLDGRDGGCNDKI